MQFVSEDVCPICQGAALLACSDQPAYQAPARYAIYHCAACNTSFAAPRQVDEELYNLIYARRRSIPSYRRYQGYAVGARQAADPLGYLAASEDMYWGISDYFASINPNGLMVLDVGSGLGYLTYALNQRGIKTLGLDISQTAVDEARRNYGGQFVCADIAAHATAVGQSYHAIILSEVIEHIPDVVGLFESLDRLLLPGGAILVTTPNKSFFPEHILWHTAPPPVHLWWFSEDSLAALGRRFGYGVEFIDYAPFNRLHPPDPALGALAAVPPGQPTRPHVLDRRGHLYHPKTPAAYARRAVRALGLGPLALRLKRRLLGRPGAAPDRAGPAALSRRGTLCAVMRRLG